jgi:hypothetical protein
LKARLRPGLSVTLTQETNYPVSGRVRLRVTPSKAAEFSLRLRIPLWSKRTEVKLNGRTIPNVKSGQYLSLQREWKKGDTIQLNLDLSLHFWAGEKECEGKVSLYRGPILLTYDRRYNKLDPQEIPPLDARKMGGRIVPWKDWIPPVLLMEFTAASGERVSLCDFGSAGEAGSPYVSWLKIQNAPKVEFSRANPLRSATMP